MSNTFGQISKEGFRPRQADWVFSGGVEGIDKPHMTGSNGWASQLLAGSPAVVEAQITEVQDTLKITGSANNISAVYRNDVLSDTDAALFRVQFEAEIIGSVGGIGSGITAQFHVGVASGNNRLEGSGDGWYGAGINHNNQAALATCTLGRQGQGNAGITGIGQVGSGTTGTLQTILPMWIDVRQERTAQWIRQWIRLPDGAWLLCAADDPSSSWFNYATKSSTANMLLRLRSLSTAFIPIVHLIAYKIFAGGLPDKYK
jgi:hypothetical protein